MGGWVAAKLDLLVVSCRLIDESKKEGGKVSSAIGLYYATIDLSF